MIAMVLMMIMVMKILMSIYLFYGLAFLVCLGLLVVEFAISPSNSDSPYSVGLL
jgi:hypothetical protein